MERFSNIGLSFECLYYFHTKVYLQMTSRGDLGHIGTSKLICETSQWTSSCMMQFLPEVVLNRP